MATADWTTAQGAAKKVYDKIQNLQPACAIFTKESQIDPDIKQTSEGFQVPTVLRPPNGFTYGGNAPQSNTMKAARVMLIEQATAVPFELVLRETVAWGVYSRLQSEGEAAVASYWGEMMMAMKQSAGTRLEASVLLGQKGWGTVESATDIDGTYATVVITPDTFRPGLFWALGPGATMDSMTTTTKNNASGPLILHSVDEDNHAIVVQYTGTLADEVDPDDVLFPEGSYASSVHYDMPGLMVQSENTTGESMGIDAGDNPNWAGNVDDVGGPLGVDVLETYFGRLRNRMAEGTLIANVPNEVYADLAAEIQSLRYVDSSYNGSENKLGQEGISYKTPKFGKVAIRIHPMLARAETLLGVDKSVVRVGSSDLTFGIPGAPKGDNALQLLYVNGTTSSDTIIYSDQAALNRKPGHWYKLNGIG